MNTPIRIVIADDHVLVRQGIRAFLETHADLSIVGEAENGGDAIRLCREKSPEVALVDLVMPGGGIETTRLIREQNPNTQVVLLTSFEDAQQIVQAVRAGALSCLLKDVDADALAEAVRKAARGEAVLHQRVAARLMELLRQENEPGAEMLDSLSQREREVLALIAEGLNNQQIAERLGIGEKTVKTHVSNVLGKLDVTDRTQAAVYAWKSGLKQRPTH
ncbi:response regulator [Dokdonella fugitiva]|jgi:NarL family two-component system response regulator LiaR|uniref:DNA-binding NarL/FixJ family response regulator n=1 Tax=Dokdonella fugitiva TaxID=328517 RepID=A0A4R2I089_9GAMM|nr:response regulator transcription factor [Dokdonella fugitiva]MBA8884528.1 NarL family two-component system response regulator LiaR [Dokdonella fugitiva]TCO37282.1 DNA-binding NarL/FixJ family response regulator [Dokdonella fugitiva]